MKIAIPVLFCMLLSVGLAQTCKTVMGGSLGKTTEGMQMCFGQNLNSNTSYGMSQKCKASGNFCAFGNGQGLATPPADLSNMTCSNATAPLPSGGMAVAGDTCGAQGPFCYGGFNCTKNTCKASASRIGVACTNSTACDIGQYCSSTMGSTCQAYPAIGANCTTDDSLDQVNPCGPAGVCFANITGTLTNGTCVAVNSLAVGT